jgi:hypothetical protein
MTAELDGQRPENSDGSGEQLERLDAVASGVLLGLRDRAPGAAPSARGFIDRKRAKQS